MKLSLNLNKIALLRNSRGGRNPSPLHAAETVIACGADGLTLHWREDERHTRRDDVIELRRLARERDVEFNLEGDPRPELVDLALEVDATQLTLVPVTPGEITSDHGWRLPEQHDELVPVIERARSAGLRTALFVEVDADFAAVAATGADRVELYTEPYAAAWSGPGREGELERLVNAVRAAAAAGLGVNAGHDLNLDNLPRLAREAPGILEVSIGHAFVADALYLGMAEATRRYLAACRGQDVEAPVTV